MAHSHAVSGTIIFDTTEVFNGTATVGGTYQDLDLSSVVGSVQALVLLKVKCAGAKYTSFRTKGLTETPPSASAPLNQIHPVNANTTGHVLLATDSNGVIEWRCETNTDNVTINIVAYWV